MNVETAKRTRYLPLLALVANIAFLLVVANDAGAQGFLLATNTKQPNPLPRPIIQPHPTPSLSYRIKELIIHARIIDQIAQVQVSQSFVNTGSRQLETRFIFPLPYDGAVDSLTLLVDGKEYPAQLLTKEKAREIYEGFMRRNQDPALLEWLGTGMFQTSVFPVPPGAERQVTITYKQILRKDHSLTDFLVPLGTAKYTSGPIDKIQIDASIESAIPIKTVYSPTHALDVTRADEYHAHVKYTVSNQIPASDFRMFYDVSPGQVGAGVLSYRPRQDEDGYFLLLASPEVNWDAAERTSKTVVCVFDRSGSMSGKKIEQAKEALKFVINNLRDGDLFNIVAYDSDVEAFQPELEKYTDQTRQAALGFVESLYAGGGTNIDGALASALGMLADDKRPSFVLFMTDGKPTKGETNESKIVAAAKQNNQAHARVINFGVGFDVNSRLLDRLARECFGTSEYIRPNEEIEDHVARLYSKISSPVMTDVEVAFEFDQVDVAAGHPISRTYPQQVTDLFEGEQLVMVGRYKKPGPAKVKITGNISSQQQDFDFPATLAEKSHDGKYAFVEKLWAMRRVGEIIDELDLHGKNDELIEELVALSTKHGILTPYTSFLADDTGTVQDLAEANLGSGRSREQASRALDELSQSEGRSAFLQRGQKNMLRQSRRVMANAPVGGLGGSDDGAKIYSLERDEEIQVAGVRNVGNWSLYKRSGMWIHTNCTDLDPARDQSQIVSVKRYSDEYFQLVRSTSKEENEALVRQRPNETLLIRLGNQAYQIAD